MIPLENEQLLRECRDCAARALRLAKEGNEPTLFSSLPDYVERTLNSTEGPSLDARANAFLRFCREQLRGEVYDLEVASDWLTRLDDGETNFDLLILEFLLD